MPRGQSAKVFDAHLLKSLGSKKKLCRARQVAEVATYRNLRRGRQSFIMALGFVAAREFADTVASVSERPGCRGPSARHPHQNESPWLHTAGCLIASFG